MLVFKQLFTFFESTLFRCNLFIVQATEEYYPVPGSDDGRIIHFLGHAGHADPAVRPGVVVPA
jgi:hypothetical protein